ncbi:tRNA (adenosine(37)-N6)-dimethylallyltransferase MiaA [Atopobacter sp. AH10]|uniref:tRNA (adenosine(37)-N6)-dimethylallyltransferase MiaA n=1 Tax=Atopobacter sp. AH10 TaxID=2315861 RepID=UPI001314D269|nr:tRNA (adenosine(37)-N6)-dimethylallyltransferase MiaA [Atopobacter sp. AH10]
MSKEELIVIAGPTASGKSDLAMQLAKEVNGAIINGDAMQVYKKVEIGTAKPSQEDQEEVDHYLVDCCNWDEDFNAFRFQTLASQAIDDVWRKGQVPIVVGGTGLYLQGLIEGFSFGQERKDSLDLPVDQMMKAVLSAIPNLKIEDLQGNDRRIRRYYQLLSEQGELAGQGKRTYPLSAAVYIDRKRVELYDRINQRVDLMVEKGLVEEAKWLLKALEEDPSLGQRTLFQAIGYKELFPYLKGQEGLDTALDHLKQATRRYAKRQLTWYRNRMPYLDPLEPERFEKWIEEVKVKLKQ